MIFKRKAYDKLLEWKNKSKGKTALLIEGARRIGKSTLVGEFAKRNYKSYIIHPKNLSIREDGIICIPAYMTFCLK